MPQHNQINVDAAVILRKVHSIEQIHSDILSNVAKLLAVLRTYTPTTYNLREHLQ